MPLHFRGGDIIPPTESQCDSTPPQGGSHGAGAFSSFFPRCLGYHPSVNKTVIARSRAVAKRKRMTKQSRGGASNMGLMIHSLDNIPESARRDYFIYLLDYGWKEPISDTLRSNFDNMAHESANNRAVIIKGTEGVHFQNEVFSWHQINGLNGDEILPALLISNNHPSYFRDNTLGKGWGHGLLNESQQTKMKLIIIPLENSVERTQR